MNIASRLATSNGVVYYGTVNTNDEGKGEIYAMNASTGALLWSYPAQGSFFGTAPPVANACQQQLRHKMTE